MVCALGSSLLYALASVLQQKAAAGEDSRHSMRLGLLARLVKRPAWLIGGGADVGGFVLQVIALGQGTLVVVQPLLVCGLLFALPIGVRWSGLRLRRHDWLAAVAVCSGLGVFLIVARPAAGHDNVSLRAWAVLLTVTFGTAAILVGASLGRSPRGKAILFSAAAGLIYGAAAALAKTTSHLLSNGVVAMLGHWQPWVLAVAGVVGMLVIQSAFQAGALDASLPTMTVVDPLVSIAIGALAFGESIATGVVASLVEVTALAVMAAGVFVLARTEAGLAAGGHAVVTL